MLTIQVEQLAQELGSAGVGLDDLAHVVGFLRSLPPEVEGKAAELKAKWLPYLEQRLASAQIRSAGLPRGLEGGAAEQGVEADEAR
jgi:hypothetical protein